ncbi:uncharacterized protein EI97DRAFT_436234 [Westerdykella ornata]|uniref:Uncharacterized protein n=1 Tax=Westerdykella ornata TaxID=318751 RepID=A0A6A6JC03_WESOR|nr:uncharacterized protein EI97DRAFT_436234 [Westerdykella ornata]KAF2273166.1 hypothetical protein EI97DRAFT_436234 [Westerdykella ornata]
MFTATSQNMMAHLAARTPVPKVKAFSFSEYRSPENDSDTDSNSSPFQSYNAVDPKPKFSSFPAPAAPNNGQRASNHRNLRLSFNIAAPDEDDVEDQSSEVKQSMTFGTQRDATHSPVPAVAAGSSSVRPPAAVPSQATAFKPRRSSALSTSQYFDAVEEQSATKHMAAIQEEEPVEPAMKKSTNREIANTQRTLKPKPNPEPEPTAADEPYYSPDEYEPHEGDLVIRDAEPSSWIHDFTGRIVTRKDYLPCTRATAADTKRLKRAAKDLIRYEESEDIYAELLDRLKRMIDREDQMAEEQQRPELSVARLARRLRSWLRRIADGQIIAGESPRFIEHQLEWADWLYAAADTGVLHVKTRRCNCKAEWTK